MWKTIPKLRMNQKENETLINQTICSCWYYELTAVNIALKIEVHPLCITPKRPEITYKYKQSYSLPHHPFYKVKACQNATAIPHIFSSGEIWQTAINHNSINDALS